MAKRKKDRSFFGMRLIDPYQKFTGLIWEELSLDKLVLRFYHKNEYNEYVCEDIISLSSDLLWNFERIEDALTYLRRTARKEEATYNLYIAEELYERIVKIYKDKAELEEITD